MRTVCSVITHKFKVPDLFVQERLVKLWPEAVRALSLMDTLKDDTFYIKAPVRVFINIVTDQQSSELVGP